MKTILKLAALAMIILSFTNCDQDPVDVEETTNEIKQEVLFQHEIVNFAWGRTHSGWLIDSSGNVHCYNLPENWTQRDSLDMISDSAMSNNLNQTDSICFTIDKDVLIAKFGLIQGASEGEISEPINRMYDAGASTYSCYLYDEENQNHKRILIDNWGDWSSTNTSSEAIELHTWLKTINDSIKKPMQFHPLDTGYDISSGIFSELH